VEVELLLRDGFPDFGEPGDTYTVSLDGGIPLSDLSFDPIGGLDYANWSSVDLQGPVIESATFALTSLPTASSTPIRFTGSKSASTALATNP
jgi:hypothetical protein